VIPFPIFAWLNMFAFAACMGGPMVERFEGADYFAEWPAGTLAHGQWTVDGDALTLSFWASDRQPVRVCSGGECLPCRYSGEPPEFCRAAFDLDGDGNVDLRDWAALTVSVVWCEAGRCLRAW